jgi:hypothetical protein
MPIGKKFGTSTLLTFNPKYALVYFAPRVVTINVALCELTKIKDFVRVNPDKELH